MAVKEKALELVHDKMNMYRWQFVGGGEVPKKLQGHWTNAAQAEQVKKSYMANRRDYPARGRTRGKKSGD